MATKARGGFDYAAQFDGPPGREELTLPSGKRVVVRPPDMAVLARRGAIPNHLLPIVERFVLGGMKTILEELPQLMQPGAEPGDWLRRSGEFNEYVAYFCVASTIEPPLSIDGDPGTIPVGWLSGDDQYAIWEWGVGLTAALAAFRGDGAGAVEPVGPLPDGEGLRDAAEPVAGVDAA